ncbi:MAG: helix-turn-helix transcriptional regulator [Firmicutes bacterium]|nr:helix-turn-helix transcriptional regulator [Bacillota bacterium]
MLTPKDLGSFIRALRLEKGMTQKQLAEKLIVTDKAVSRWERGLGFPDIQFLEPLCAALGVTIEELLSARKDEPAQDSSAVISQSESPQNSIQAIIDSFEEARNAFQVKKKKRRKIFRISLLLLTCVLIILFVPFPQRISRTLTGVVSMPGGSKAPVTVQIKGFVWHHFFEGDPWEHNFRFHDRSFSGKIIFKSEALEGSPVTWRFTGKKTAMGSDYTGALWLLPPDTSRETAMFRLTGFSFPDNECDTRFSTDFSKLVLGKSTSLNVQIIAAEDPYTDYQKLYDEFWGVYH